MNSKRIGQYNPDAIHGQIDASSTTNSGGKRVDQSEPHDGRSTARDSHFIKCPICGALLENRGRDSKFSVFDV